MVTNHVWVDVTKHNSNLPPLAVKNPDCLGLLHKMDKSKDSWVQHYCILKDGCLYLYSGIRATHAQGGIYLQGYMVREQSYGAKNSIIELKPPSDEFRTFYLCAENANENKRWIIAIKASIKKWLPLHQALQHYMNGPPEETRM
uniref:PH domain-containing protein n=1 Tax=Oreochromis aureus TaxID=47969 RepID=A0A668U4F7_OREAU